MYCSICQTNTTRKPFLTNGKDFEYGVPGTYTQTMCVSCGLIATDPMPDDETILSFYPETYHGYQPAVSALTQFLIKRNLKARAVAYKKLVGDKASFLDVGSADGSHFDEWKKIEPGWDFYGFEFHDGAAQAGREAGRDIQTATIETYDAKGNTFNAIIVNHLLEHVPDPRNTADRAFALLKPGGWLIGETPNIKSLDFFLFKRFWGGTHWPRHVHQFSPDVMKKMLTDAGYTNIRFQYPLHTGHWALSVQNLIESRHGTKRLKNGRAWYYPFLLLLFVPINLIQKLCGYTGIMSFQAQKPLA